MMSVIAGTEAHPTLAALGFILLCLFTSIAFFSNRKYSLGCVHLPPGSMGLPIIGEMLEFIAKAATGEFFTIREARYGPIFKTHILLNPTIFVSGREAVKKITLGEHALVENAWPRSMQVLLGEGSLAASLSHAHKARKQSVVRCFRRERLEEYFLVVNHIIQDELKKWMTLGRVDLYASAQKMTIRAAAKVMLGFEGPQLNNVEKDILEYAGGFFSLPIALPGTAFYRAVKAKNRLRGILEPMLRARHAHQGTGHVKHDTGHAQQGNGHAHKDAGGAQALPPNDVLSSLFSKSRKFTNNNAASNGGGVISNGTAGSDISPQPSAGSVGAGSFTCPHSIDQVCEHAINQSLELLFGGQGTLSGLVTCLVMLLRENPHVIERIRAELADNNLMETGEEDCIDFESLRRLSYTWNVIREVLRMYPPVGGGYRRALKTFDIEEYQIPKDWSITYSIKSTHDSSPLYASDTDRFVPERWNVLDNDVTMTHFDFMPFGAGARACVGKEYAKMFSRLFCVNLVRMTEWVVLMSDPVMLRVPVIRPQGALHAIFRPYITA